MNTTTATGRMSSTALMNAVLPAVDDSGLVNQDDQILSILKEPDDTLKVVCRMVEEEEFGDELAAFLSGMATCMVMADGIGLAAPQVGDDRRIIVLWQEGSDQPIGMVNPQITWRSGESVTWNEQCLSCPGLEVKRERAQAIEVSFQDAAGETHFLKLTDRDAVCFQHEQDHLNGHTLYDAASPTARRKYLESRMTPAQRAERARKLRKERRKQKKKGRR